MNQQMLELFEYWILEREAIRQRRNLCPKGPWTDDPILRNFHFCNVRREDDRGTKEIRAVVARHYITFEHLPAAYTLARMLNNSTSLGVVLEDGIDTLKSMHRKGMKVFHTAYVVSTCGVSMGKLDYVEEVVGDVTHMEIPRTSCRAAFDALRTVDGLGSFMAGQIVADLKNDRYLAEAPDWFTFSVMGPGSRIMLNHLFGGGTTERNYESRISELEQALSPEVRALNLHRQDLQNCLCESGKYVRLKNNLPGRRRPYHAI